MINKPGSTLGVKFQVRLSSSGVIGMPQKCGKAVPVSGSLAGVTFCRHGAACSNSPEKKNTKHKEENKQTEALFT